LISLEAYAVIVYSTETTIKPSSQFGNFEHVRRLLSKDDKGKKEFSFAIVGDARGTGVFERIVDQLRDEPLSFMVVLGDFVHRATEGHHAFFIAETQKELAMPFPVFLVAGNHDIDDKGFPVSRFEEVYGPSNFSFVYNDCLFVILLTKKPPYSNEDSLKYAEDILSKGAGKYSKTFVMTHFPPSILGDMKKAGFAGDQTMVSLMDKYKVDYYIAGHHHGYARARVKDTVYLVSGGGGNHLEKEKYGRFNHAITLGVSPDFVSESILEVEHSDDMEDRLERFAIADVYPFMTDRPLLTLLINASLLLFLAMSFLKRSGIKPRGQAV